MSSMPHRIAFPHVPPKKTAQMRGTIAKRQNLVGYPGRWTAAHPGFTRGTLKR
jgi:hypothetical protein